MKITIAHNGFHGYTSRTIILVGAPGERVALTCSQAKKLARAACGTGDCRCGESMLSALASRDGDMIDSREEVIYHVEIPADCAEIALSGNYPQN